MSVKQSLEKLKKVVTLCEQHGFAYQMPINPPESKPSISFGPLGSEFRRNIIRSWWRDVVTHQEHVFGVDSPFNSSHPEIMAETVAPLPQKSAGREESAPSPIDESFNHIQNLLPHYENVLSLSERRLPVGLAKVGCCHSKRTYDPDRFIYQHHAYSYFSLSFFCAPVDAAMWLNKWHRLRLQWWRKFCGKPSAFTSEDVKPEGSRQVFDIKYPFPWGEDVVERLTSDGGDTMEQLNNSGRSTLKGKAGRKSVLPHLIQSVGHIEGGMLAYLLDAYNDAAVPTQAGKRKRQVLRLHYHLCPVKVAVVTMEPSDDVQQVSDYLAKEFRAADINIIQTTAALLKPFEKLDKMGVPYAILISEETTKSGVVKIRNRDTTLLQEVHISRVKQELQR